MSDTQSLNMPEEWEPNVPAFEAQFNEEIDKLIFAYIGVQSKDKSPAEELDKVHDRFIHDEDVGHAERARYTDPEGFDNEYLICYWKSAEAYESWWKESGFRSFWESQDLESEQFGYWLEKVSVSGERLETMFSRPEPQGIGMLGDEIDGPIQMHEYWGAMRDRLEISRTDKLKSSLETMDERVETSTTEQRVRLQLEENLCLIRSGQDLRRCDSPEKESYDEIIRPELEAGMEYLELNSEESGCLACRFSDEKNIDGSPDDKTFGAAWFRSLGDLEKWSEDHPSHLAIFNSFFKHIENIGFENVDLKLWHEVLVTSGEDDRFEYVSCHQNTGLLPWLEQVQE